MRRERGQHATANDARLAMAGVTLVGVNTSSPSTQTDQTPSPFLERTIRLLALVMLAYAAAHIVQFGLIALIQGVGWQFADRGYRWAERAVQLSAAGVMLLLLVGAIGLLKFKPWARPAVMLWAVLTIVLGFVSGLPWLLKYASDVAAAAATTRAVYQPIWQVVLWTLFAAVGQVFFPLLVWLILRQPEVASLFARAPRGGFEVLPLAQPVRSPTPVASGGSSQASN